jgi:cell shape-determining protein MreC
LTPKKRGRKADTQAQELLALRQENERLKTRLHQAELIIDAQKKLAQVLETTVNPCPRETSK